jgi:hypothetical protein
MKRVQWDARELDRYFSLVNAFAAFLATFALVVVGLRAALRLEPWWDTFWYHIPFAALRGGLRIPYEMSDKLRDWYAGFPPLPDFVQGVLWRVTGSINATGVINYLAFALFLYFCHRKLGARFWIVAIVSLTAPLVLIHAATSYVDLFSNAFLAIGTSTLVAMYLFDRFNDRSLLLWGLAGLAAAAWSKVMVVPVVALFLISFLVIYGSRRADPAYRQLFVLTVIATFVAAAPYIKNLIVYHNPFWPLRVPLVGEYFPYTEDVRDRVLTETPPPLLRASQFELFFRSLLEFDNPTHYANRTRWTIDQGSTWESHRMGGFWHVAVVTATAAIAALSILWNRRKGLMLLGAMAGLLCFVAVLPQSHELRYHQFLPLTMAATIGMLLPRIRRTHPGIALIVLSVLLTEFVYISNVNRWYYTVQRIGYMYDAIPERMPAMWDQLERGKVYCAVGFEPVAFMLTGPTMSEFKIIDRSNARLCPSNTVLLLGPPPK